MLARRQWLIRIAQIHFNLKDLLCRATERQRRGRQRQGDAGTRRCGDAGMRRREGSRGDEYTASLHSPRRPISPSPPSPHLPIPPSPHLPIPLSTASPYLRLGFRMFRPPLRAMVDASRGYPQQISAWGPNRSVYGRVVRLAGPWRKTGDWWRDDSWGRDEWDIAIEQSGSAVKRAGDGGTGSLSHLSRTA